MRQQLKVIANALKVIANIIFLIATAFFAGAAWNFFDVQKKLQTWETAEATMIKYVPKAGSTSHCPLFKFLDKEGVTQEYRGHCSKPSRWRYHEKTTIYYDPKAPASALVDTTYQKYANSIILGVVGLLSIVIGSLFRFASNEKIPPDPPPPISHLRQK